MTASPFRGEIWNCNGALWICPNHLEGFLEAHDFICITKTHERPNRGLPYSQGMSCGRDEEPHLMWVRIKERWIYIIICYFPPWGFLM
ncbi:hypothetical protein KP509_14G026300 [Ceratopteris richardii]|uniref:Uncharacterized protein n=1 Tax=Ceratopteris richardii TaxID=49495 RepID=A0A8T2T800_CERRI|nr:hypothetical protein KP509_14G026300 [Ceratopteris richardii]